MISTNKCQNKQLKVLYLRYRMIPRYISSNHRCSAKSFSTTNSTERLLKALHLQSNTSAHFCLSLTLNYAIHSEFSIFGISNFRSHPPKNSPYRGWFRRNITNARGRHVGFLHPPVIARMSLSSFTLCQSADLSARRRWFQPSSIHVGYVMTKEVALK